MKFEKTITVTVSNRPNYFSNLVRSLNTLHGINEYLVVFSIEPNESLDENLKICDAFNFNYIINVNKYIQGVRQHPYNILNWVYKFSKFNVYLEEDISISRDILSMANFFNVSNETSTLLCFFNKSGIEISDNTILMLKERPNDEISCNRFAPFGWCMNVDKWDSQFKQWWNIDPRGWDYSVSDKMIEHKCDICVSSTNRCNHIGEFGTHSTPISNVYYTDKKIYDMNCELEYEYYNII